VQRDHGVVDLFENFVPDRVLDLVRDGEPPLTPSSIAARERQKTAKNRRGAAMQGSATRLISREPFRGGPPL